MNKPVTATNLRALAPQFVTIANQYADASTRETGVNRGAAVEWMQQTVHIPPGSSWCAAFVYAVMLKVWCQAQGLMTAPTAEGNRPIMLAHADEFSRETLIPRTGYCPTIADIAKRQNRFHGPAFAPSAGDLVTFDFHNQGEPHHVAFVRGVRADGQLLTTEGNTSAGAGGSQADGDGVFKRVRSRVSVYGFVHFE